MRDHILTITKRGSWTVSHIPNAEPHPDFLCQRIEHAAGVFLNPPARRRLRLFPRRPQLRLPAGAFWIALDEGNLHIGRRLTPAEQLAHQGVLA